MAPSSPASYQKQLLDKISEVNNKVDKSLEQGRDNGEEIRMLRKELGVDGTHGRIPGIEQSIVKLEFRIETLQKCVDLMEDSNHFAKGKQWVITIFLSFLSSSGGVWLFEWLVRRH